MLREAEVQLSKGQNIAEVCRGLGITDQTYYVAEKAKDIGRFGLHKDNGWWRSRLEKESGMGYHESCSVVTEVG